MLRLSSFLFIATLAHHRLIVSCYNSMRSGRILHAMSQSQEKPILKVAIIGGGIAGLSCASHLLSLSASSSTAVQIQPIVFDTGRLRPGGRCSSRYPSDKPKRATNLNRILFQQGIIDHAAQLLKIPMGEPWTAFREQVRQWEAQGVIMKFPPNSIGHILPSPTHHKQNTTTSNITQSPLFHIQWLNSKTEELYYGSQGMASIPQAMRNRDGPCPIPIEQDVWISPSSGLEFHENHWVLRSNTKSYGSFDRVVIAHNGKCAFRLSSNTPATALHQLLDTNFYFTVPPTGGTKMTLNSIYSLTIAVKMRDHESTSVIGKAIGQESFHCAFIHNEPNLQFLTCQSRKFKSTQKKTSQYEVWTILSSPKLAKQYKAPQENIPPHVQDQVVSIMLSSLERCLHLEKGILSNEGESSFVSDSYLQLWGAAVPINTWKNQELDMTPIPQVETNGFVYDAEWGIGACGDWLLDPSIAGAWESGRRLAHWIEYTTQVDQRDMKRYSVGLPPHGTFQASKNTLKTGIGNL